MAVASRAVADADSVLSSFTPEEMLAWGELDHDHAESLVRWVLQARRQRTRRDRVEDLRRMARLQVLELPNVDVADSWWVVWADPLLWLGLALVITLLGLLFGVLIPD